MDAGEPHEEGRQTGHSPLGHAFYCLVGVIWAKAIALHINPLNRSNRQGPKDLVSSDGVLQARHWALGLHTNPLDHSNRQRPRDLVRSDRVLQAQHWALDLHTNPLNHSNWHAPES